MGRKTVALSLDEGIYTKFKKYCDDNSMIVSRKIDKYMKEELEKKKNG